MTGGLRVGVSYGIIKESLTIYGSRTSNEIEEYFHGFQYYFKDLFEWLDGKNLPRYIDRKQLFNSFMLANNFKYEEFIKLNSNKFTAEYKWDGIRAQIIFSKTGKIFSRGGEDITQSFPDINISDSGHYVVDGELVIKKGEDILSFNNLQKKNW